MNRSDSPKKQPKPFGVNGQRVAILPTTPAGDNSASYEQGFPPITMILKSAGGLPPKGQDMNQILYELSALGRWSSTGALNTFDSEFASEISGYPSGAMLISDDGERIFINTTEGNLSDPNSNGTGWKDILSYLGLGEAAKMSAAALVINGNTLTAKIPVVINGVNREFIIQASQISSSARNGVITFPSAFPNACIAIFAHDFATVSTDLSNVRFYMPGRTSASWIGQNMSTGSESSPATWCWLAIGW
ncbi:TPA: hypothetical protein ACIX3N_002559 [Escherichia coli]